MSVHDIRAQLEVHRTTVTRALDRLVEHGLVAYCIRHDRYYALPADLDAVADKFGARERAEARKEEHREDRYAHLRRLEASGRVEFRDENGWTMAYKTGTATVMGRWPCVDDDDVSAF